MFPLFLIFGGLTAFFGSIACFSVAVVIGSGMWVNVAAAVFGLSAGQFLGFVLITKKEPPPT